MSWISTDTDQQECACVFSICAHNWHAHIHSYDLFLWISRYFSFLFQLRAHMDVPTCEALLRTGTLKWGIQPLGESPQDNSFPRVAVWTSMLQWFIILLVHHWFSTCELGWSGDLHYPLFYLQVGRRPTLVSKANTWSNHDQSQYSIPLGQRWLHNLSQSNES